MRTLFLAPGPNKLLQNRVSNNAIFTAKMTSSETASEPNGGAKDEPKDENHIREVNEGESNQGTSHESSITASPANEKDYERQKTTYGWKFWAIFVALCVTSLLAAVETTVTSTALPFIAHELNAGELYVWFVNSYFLTRYVSPTN